MFLFAQAATPAPAELTPQQIAAKFQEVEQARWANELPYFQWLHKQLPEPFFQTQGFLVFFLAVAAAYWLLPRRWNTLRVCLLVVASFHFYAAWNASLALLVTTTATLDYLFARGMEATNRRAVRRSLMWASIVMNLGV